MAIEYKEVKNVKLLKPKEVTLSGFERNAETTIGTDLAEGEGPSQLDILYANDVTLVIPKNGKGNEPVMSFTDYLSPQDIRSWYRWTYHPEAEQAAQDEIAAAEAARIAAMPVVAPVTPSPVVAPPPTPAITDTSTSSNNNNNNNKSSK